MATLRAVEERDAKGNPYRLNPSIMFKQDRQIRKVVGRHDFHMLDNPDYHPPITVQVQNGKLLFFEGLPDTAATRTMAKEIPQSRVPKYIIDGLTAHPMKVREVKPSYYEVKLAVVGDVEVAQAVEIDTGSASEITITPVSVVPPGPNPLSGPQGGAPASA